MNDEYCIKYKVYDSALYDRLTKEYWGKETPEEIKNWRPNYSKSQKSYFFHIKRSGKNGNKKYSEDDFDLYALVMLDIKQIAYLVNKNINSESITLRDRNLKYYNEQKSRYFQDLTLEKALKELENV